MAVRKRAIHEKDKLRRREKILKTAWALYKKSNGQLPTVSVLARKAGLSKGTVYLYFKTKNEIFLHLYLHQLRRWHDEMAQTLGQHPGKITVREYAQITTEYVVKNPIMLKLGSIATGAIQEDTDQQLVVEIKVGLAKILDDRSRLVCKLFPGLTREEWVKVHLRIYALIFGVWQMYYSPPHVRRLLQESETDIFDAGFSKNVVEAVATFLTGALHT